MRVWIVKDNGWVKAVFVNPNNLSETLAVDGNTYYLNSIHKDDVVPKMLNSQITGIWYSDSPSKNTVSDVPVYLPPLV